jgi:hypothetical protein
MKRISWSVVTALAVITGCGGTAERKSAAEGDTATAAPPPPPETLPPTNVADVAGDTGAEYVVHGVCPFACCKYGNWTLQQGGALRSEPSSTADSVGNIAVGSAVQSDEGVMVLHPPGIAVVVPDTSAHSSGPGIGDTVDVISYTGSKVSRVRWHDQEFDMSWGALQMLREPAQRWWVHMTDRNTGQAGWLQMSGVSNQEMGTPSSCSNK